MTKCGGCGRFLSAAEAARCQQCSAIYHRRCAALPTSGTIAVTWHCPECKKDRVTDNKAETPVRGSAPTPPLLPDCAGVIETVQDLSNDITTELRAFRDNVRSINLDLQLFRDDIAEIRASLKAYHNKVDQLEERVSVLEKTPPPSTDNVVDVIAQLKQDLNDRDQELMANDVEIANLAERGGENPVHLAMQIAVKLGVTMEARDIVSAERVGARRVVATEAAGPEPRPRLLAVRLARRDLRDQLMSSARARRDATSADLGLPGPPRRFYVNARLTNTNRRLFREVRDAGQLRGWQFVWFKHGHIFARNKPGDKAFRIRCDSDIFRFLGQAPAAEQDLNASC